MSEVTLQVGGRPYTVSCADGEEDHIHHLAEIINSKLAGLGGALPPGDTKALLFAALFLADEVDEARRQGAPPPAPLLEDGNSRRLETIADRIEKLADMLESGEARA